MTTKEDEAMKKKEIKVIVQYTEGWKERFAKACVETAGKRKK